jgi:thiol-disulfide isomerase/thioredoxin
MDRAIRIGFFVLLAVIGGLVIGGPHTLPDEVPSAPVIPPPVKIKLYLFTAEWCGPCQALHREMKDAAVQSELARFDLTETQDSGLQSKYGVNGYPTFVAITSAGPVKHVGYCTAAELVKWLSSLK